MAIRACRSPVSVGFACLGMLRALGGVWFRPSGAKNRKLQQFWDEKSSERGDGVRVDVLGGAHPRPDLVGGAGR